MQIRLENIGIIKDSTIVLDGLTVITGKNNSGKTTVGKTLYAILDAVCNLQQKAKNDRRYYIRKQLYNVENSLDFFRYIYRYTRRAEQQSKLFEDHPILEAFLDSDYLSDYSVDDIEKFAHELAAELASCDVSIISKDKASQESLLYKRLSSIIGKREDDSIESMLDSERNSALAMLGQLFIDLEKDMGLVDYARESINQTLRIEFSNQIQPVGNLTPYSKIKLMNGDSVCFDVVLADNSVVNDGTPVFMSSPFKKVYLVDDPFVMDDISNEKDDVLKLNKIYFKIEKTETETILNSNRIRLHNDKLKTVLRKSDLSVFEQTVLDDSLKTAKARIDNIIPGAFEFTSEGAYYIQNGMKLRISNLATGSKMFSIIKMLLEKGELDSKTMLILDEPEAHLHPKWQNAFAEIIVLLVEELGVNILLTTHSPNFMLALDAYMRKYAIVNITNFYQTEFLNDNFVHYKCVNNDMGKIYQDFLQYLSEVKMLRKEYLSNDGE